MSRHRFVRNIDINEELDDDYVTDGGEDDLSPEDYDRMMDGLEHIRATLGDERQSALTDQEIKDSLYEFYFDVEQAIADLLEKQERKFIHRERQDEDGKPLPRPPPDEDGDWSSTTDSTSGRHNVPFVRLTQSDYFSSSDQETTRASVRPGTLYTITELTELSEDTRGWNNSQQHAQPPVIPYLQPRDSRATFVSSVTTDYGQPIERPSIHPEELAVSPSPSALQRLSYQDDSATPLSRRTSSSSRDTVPAPSTSGAVPTLENLPDIPDLKSKSSLQRPLEPSQTSLLSKKSQRTTENTASEKKSKLSALASSRSSARSSVSSVSARSYITETASDVTYPALRPSAASMISLIPEKRLPSRPSTISEQSESSLPSSMSRVVKAALDSALALEALDREPPTPKEPTTLSIPTSRPLSDISSTSTETTKPLSKPISLKEYARASPVPPTHQSSPSGSSAPSTSPGQPRQLSKLARLAQAKAQEQSQTSQSAAQAISKPSLILPRSHTEYLVPTANGPTATTAITTSYQSLGSLLTKDQSKLPPSMQYPSPSSPGRTLGSSKQSEPKQSKLAMKSKSARTKAEPEPEQFSISPVIDVPIFSPKATRSRASPSAFASLLTDDDLPSSQVGVHSQPHHRHRKADREHKHRKERSEAEKAKRHKHKERDVLPLPPAPLPSLRGFTFDVPSPDDIVFNARKGTSLGQRSESTRSPLSVGSSR